MTAMGQDNTLLGLEADLLSTRFNNWIRVNIGEENAQFQKYAQQPERQKYLLEVFFRFLCSTVVAADLANQTLERIDTIKALLAQCSYLAELLANNNSNAVVSSGIQTLEYTVDSNVDTPIKKFTAAFRTRLRTLIRLFQLVSSTDYIVKLLNEDKILKLGALTLHLWGESLLAYAETSLRYWKPQRIQCLKLAEDRLLKCLMLTTNRHQSAFLLGNVLVLQAKEEPNSSACKLLLEKAYKAYSFAAQLLTTFPEYVSAMTRVCALQNNEAECQHWLRIWLSTRPANPLQLLDEPDFDKFRSKKWFGDIGASLMPPPTVAQASSSFDEKRYNILQNSLLESGFSMKKLLELLSWLPVSSGESQIRADDGNEYTRKQKERLQQRLDLFQLKPKRDIPGDGNCQMHAISDQLYDTIAKSADIRRMVVDWLEKNRDLQLPNGAILHQFVHDRKWEDYCAAMAKDGCWGDHLTLLAISEIFGAQISIFSSVEGDNFITEIHPTTKKLNKVLLLSHYAEFHYGSLAHIIETPLI